MDTKKFSELASKLDRFEHMIEQLNTMMGEYVESDKHCSVIFAHNKESDVAVVQGMNLLVPDPSMAKKIPPPMSLEEENEVVDINTKVAGVQLVFSEPQGEGLTMDQFGLDARMIIGVLEKLKLELIKSRDKLIKQIQTITNEKSPTK